MGEIVNKLINVTIKDLISYSVMLVSITTVWFSLNAEIQVAKKLPEPEVNRVEFELKNRIIQESVFRIEKDIKEIKAMITKIDDKVYEQNAK